ncbi:unnamed protein product [Laminaria digitata]
MAEARARRPRRPRQSLAATVAVCFCSLSVLAPPYLPGHAYVIPAAATRARLLRRLVATTATYRRCNATPAEQAEEMMPFSSGDTDGDSDQQAEYDDNDDNEDDVHPSVAWLYPSSATPPPSGGSSSTASRKKLRRTLCVDYGTRRVGLAIGIGISPRVVPGVTNRGNELEVVRQVLIRARGEGIRDIVVGLPLERQVYTSNGTEAEMCQTVRGFASMLADAGAASRPSASVFLWDERFSSAQAEAMLDPYGGGISRKVEIDSLAASVILDDYFAGGGRDGAERVEPGEATAATLFAAGRDGQGGRGGGEEEQQEEEEDMYGEGSRQRLDEMRAESARSAAAGDDFVPTMRAPKRRRKRR